MQTSADELRIEILSCLLNIPIKAIRSDYVGLDWSLELSYTSSSFFRSSYIMKHDKIIVIPSVNLLDFSNQTVLNKKKRRVFVHTEFFWIAGKVIHKSSPYESIRTDLFVFFQLLSFISYMNNCINLAMWMSEGPVCVKRQNLGRGRILRVCMLISHTGFYTHERYSQRL